MSEDALSFERTLQGGRDSRDFPQSAAIFGERDVAGLLQHVQQRVDELPRLLKALGERRVLENVLVHQQPAETRESRVVVWNAGLGVLLKTVRRERDLHGAI